MESGLILVYQTGLIEIRSLPHLELVGESSLMSILRWNFKISMSKTISSSDTGQIMMVIRVIPYSAIQLFAYETYKGHLGTKQSTCQGRIREKSWENTGKILKLNSIQVGIIKGLQYLHFSCSPSVLHYNLKPTNVMFDAEFEPRLADCGLAMLIPNLDRATSGYGTPECFQNCRYTEKSDIFSFGVILGVLLTGRDPMDTFFGEVASGGSLGRWLRHLQQAGEAVRIAPLTKLC